MIGEDSRQSLRPNFLHSGCSCIIFEPFLQGLVYLEAADDSATTEQFHPDEVVGHIIAALYGVIKHPSILLWVRLGCRHDPS